MTTSTNDTDKLHKGIQSLLAPWFQDPVPKPDHVNELGVEWWVDRSSTAYARNADTQGTKLPDITVFYVREKDGTTSHLITDSTGVLTDARGLEDLGAKIDMLKVQKRFNGSSRKTKKK